MTKLILEDQNFFKNKVKELIKEALKLSYEDVDLEKVEVEYPASQEHGDYSSNIALKLSKDLGRNPREIAEKIKEAIQDSELIEKVDIAGPGFLNFFISKESLNQELAKVLAEKDKYGNLNIGNNEDVIVEYSSPNIAKPLGVHHLLTITIGQSLYNIYKFCGFNTISIDHIGDWGTQYGKLTHAYKTWGAKEEIEKDPIPELLKLYVKFHDESEKDSSIEDLARAEFKKLEEGDNENKEIWQWFVDISLKEINDTYDKLGGIKFDQTVGESFYEDKMPAILEDGKKKNIIVEGEQGAFVVNFDDEKIPTVPVQKKDGATLYITRDLATLKYRIETINPKKILYVVDTAQTLHFKQLFSIANMLGFYDDQAEHVVFGRMSMKEGNMSTRKGNVVLLKEVLDEAVSRAKKIIEEKDSDLEDIENIAYHVGVGAVKYSILSQNRISDIVFDWDNMLSLDGNSAPYLLYTYARARSILRKSDIERAASEKIDFEIDEKAMNLLRKLPKLSEQIAKAAESNKPNIIANYLYSLAQDFNSLYNSVSILGEENQNKKIFLLNLVDASSQVIKNALSLLCIEVVEEM